MKSLPHLPEIFNRLRLGYHYTASDTALFPVLWKRFNAYKETFAVFGLRLQKHPEGVVYLDPGAAEGIGKRTRRMGLFVLILVEWMSNERPAILPDFFETWWPIDDLPHLEYDRYREYMEHVQVEHTGDLQRIVNQLAKYGFAETRSNGSFQFRTAAYRFLDLCIEAIELEAEDDATADAASRPHDPAQDEPTEDEPTAGLLS